MDKKVIMYFHSGSENHGCEALVRSTHKLLNECNLSLYSFSPEEDLKYDIDKIVNVYPDSGNIKKNLLKYMCYKVKYKLTKDDQHYYKLLHQHIYDSIKKGDVALSIGGDNYCYEGLPERLAEFNQNLNRKKARTILWGCSIEPKLLKNKNILKDLNLYSLIFARESITYEALCKNGLESKTVLFPDPAFVLDTEKVELPKNFKKSSIVGINLSPLVQKSNSNPGLVKSNYLKLIEFILNTTNMKIMFVPHVIWEDSDDRQILKELYDKYRSSGRVMLVEDCNCMVLKGYISQCRFFVGARTHSTIAAYSSEIPTVVMGYSVKAKGIAKDLFGDYAKYVLAAQDLRSDKELTNAFKYIMDNEIEIKKILKEKVEDYKIELRKLYKML